MSGPLFARPGKGKVWRVDDAAMDAIETSIAKRALEVYGPAIAEAARDRAQAEIDEKLPALVAKVRAQTAVPPPSKPGWHREYAAQRDPSGRLTGATERWVRDDPAKP